MIVELDCREDLELKFVICYCSGRGKKEFREGQPFQMAVFLPGWFYEELELLMHVHYSELPDYVQRFVLGDSLSHFRVLPNGTWDLSRAMQVEKPSNKHIYDTCSRCPLAPEEHYYLAEGYVQRRPEELIEEIVNRILCLWRFYISRKVYVQESVQVVFRCKSGGKKRIEVLKRELKLKDDS